MPLAKIVKHETEDEEIIIHDVEYFEEEYIARVQIIGVVTIKGKKYKFDKMIEVELDIEESEG